MSDFQRRLHQDLLHAAWPARSSSHRRHRQDSVESVSSSSSSSSSPVGSVSNSIGGNSFEDQWSFGAYYNQHRIKRAKEEQEQEQMVVIGYIKEIELSTLYRIFYDFCKKHVILASSFNEEEAKRRAQNRGLSTCTFFMAEQLVSNLVVVMYKDSPILFTEQKVFSIKVTQEGRKTRIYHSKMQVFFDCKHYWYELVPEQSTLGSISKKTQILDSVVKIKNLFNSKKELKDNTAAQEWMSRRMINFTRRR